MLLSVSRKVNEIEQHEIEHYAPCILYFRIANEEKVLAQDLQGYTEYMRKMRYRLVPYIWRGKRCQAREATNLSVNCFMDPPLVASVLQLATGDTP